MQGEGTNARQGLPPLRGVQDHVRQLADLVFPGNAGGVVDVEFKHQGPCGAIPNLAKRRGGGWVGGWGACNHERNRRTNLDDTANIAREHMVKALVVCQSAQGLAMTSRAGIVRRPGATPPPPPPPSRTAGPIEHAMRAGQRRLHLSRAAMACNASVQRKSWSVSSSKNTAARTTGRE